MKVNVYINGHDTGGTAAYLLTIPAFDVNCQPINWGRKYNFEKQWLKKTAPSGFRLQEQLHLKSNPKKLF